MSKKHPTRHETLDSDQIERILRHLDMLDRRIREDVEVDYVLERADRDRAAIDRQVRSTGRY